MGERESSILRTLIDNLPDGIFLKDRHSRFVFANRIIAEMMHAADPEALLGKTDHDFYTRDVADELLADERLLIETKSTFVNKAESKQFSSGVRWILTSKVAVIDEGGEVTGLLGITRDVTERYEAEARLRASEERYRSLLDQAADGIFLLDPVGAFLMANQEACAMLGYSIEELLRLTFLDTYPEVLRDEGVRRRDTLAVGEKVRFEREVRRKDGTTFPGEISVRKFADGTMQEIMRDITEQKRSRERIESLARFPDEDPNPVMRVTPNGTLIYGNRASSDIIAWWAAPETRGILDQYRRALTRAWESGENQEVELQAASKRFSVTIVPIPTGGYINLYAKDVTEERALADRLNQAQKIEAIGLLTGGVAHDFNNILQAITGYCEILTNRVSAKNRTYTAEIMKAAHRAASLTTQLLAFSRRQVLRPRVVDTKELVDSMRKMLKRIIGDDIKLRTIMSADTGNFFGDPGQMEQVLLNLVVNARDAMPQGGVLTIETSNRAFDEAYAAAHPGAKAGSYVRLAVSDTGIGMSEETLQHIYDPFFTTKEFGKGTGLGLSVVYGIVKQSDGYINCYSEVGKGTTFTVYLPMTAESAEELPAAFPPEPVPGGTETILLVDDDPASRSVTRMALEEAGYSVVEAAGGAAALEEVRKRRIQVDLLITDVVMHYMSGKELAQNLARMIARVPVLYVSGYTAEVISHHGILESDVDFLEKPFSSSDLLRKVRGMLDRT